MNIELEAIVTPLLDWYDGHARILPWRDAPTPYRVWVSEIMLQQTRVEAVIPYFERFLRELPNFYALATVPEERLLKLWEGLGYYNRARNLQKAAQCVVREYNGELPRSFDELLKLPGIGRYTAGAISSIAYGIPVPAVDGNVLRVMSRIRLDYSNVSEQPVKRNMEGLIAAIIPKDRAGAFNQALMELGATVCLPNGTPKCGNCPVRGHCEGYKRDCMNELPVKTAKKDRKIEDKTVFVLIHNGKTAVRQRGLKGLLAGMWEFPNVSGGLTEQQVKAQVEAWGIVPEQIEKLGGAKHIFTHAEWHMTGYLVRAARTDDKNPFVWADQEELKNRFAIPAAFRSFRQ